MQKKKPAPLTKADTTYGQYLSMVQGGQPTDNDTVDTDRYAWAQYQRLFALNHANMAEARAEALARQLARGR